MPGNKKNSKQNRLIRRNRGSLLYRGKTEAKPKSTSLERVEPAWKAGTLPTELLPQLRDSCELFTKDHLEKFIKSR